MCRIYTFETYIIYPNMLFMFYITFTSGFVTSISWKLQIQLVCFTGNDKILIRCCRFVQIVQTTREIRTNTYTTDWPEPELLDYTSRDGPLKRNICINHLYQRTGGRSNSSYKRNLEVSSKSRVLSMCNLFIS